MNDNHYRPEIDNNICALTRKTLPVFTTLIDLSVDL